MTFEGTNASKFCTACATRKIREYDRRKNTEDYARHKKEGWNRVCEKCKTPFLTWITTRKLCDDCFEENKQRRQEERRKRQEEKEAEKKRRSQGAKRKKHEYSFDADQCIYARQLKTGDTVYKTCICLDGKQIYLGCHKTRDEAKQARISAYKAYMDSKNNVEEDKMITYTDFRRLLTDATECQDRDSYIAEVGGSVSLRDVTEVMRILDAIWTMGHDGLTIKSVSEACEISMRQIAIKYGLPTRTVESWSSGERKPPKWQLPLIAYAVLSDAFADKKAGE